VDKVNTTNTCHPDVCNREDEGYDVDEVYTTNTCHPDLFNGEDEGYDVDKVNSALYLSSRCGQWGV
jgi:hypothetical protein